MLQQAWIEHADTTMSQDKATGLLRTKDEGGNPILLVWEKVPTQSARLNEMVKGISDILVNTYTHIELQFAKKFPEKVANEYFLQTLAGMFAEGADAVEWALAEAKIKQVFQAFFSTTDFSAFTKPDEIYLFVIALNQLTGEPLGVIQFLISAEYPYGSVKACYFGVTAQAQDRGIEKLLLAAIFNILPTTNRLFLHTRSTNTEAIAIYQNLGFAQFSESMLGWPDFEYLADNAFTLQAIAETYA